MRFHLRGRGGGISVGPVGLLIVGPIYLLVALCVLAIKAAILLVGYALALAIVVSRAVREHREEKRSLP